MTNPTAPPFAPLPVRARGTLEIFDTAFKLFRRYAGVLLGWSFLSSVINLIPLGFFGYVFTLPLFYGCAACVIAAAVRGQNVSFGQVWGFTKPRYGAILGVLILAGLLLFALMIGVSLGVALISVSFVSAASSLGWAATILAWIVGVVGGAVATSLILALAIGWFTLAPLVACLEDQHRGSTSMSRALSLMSGHWRKACAVAVILGLATTAIMMILGSAIGFLFYGGWDKLLGADTSDSATMGLLTSLGGVSTLFYTISMPLLALVTGVFYLDLRTRKEALDLEWTNYAAKPESLDQAPDVASPNVTAPNAITPGPLGTNAQIMASPSALDAGVMRFPAINPTPASEPPSPVQMPFVPPSPNAPPIYIPVPPPAIPAQASPLASSSAQSSGEDAHEREMDSFASFASELQETPVPNAVAPSTESISPATTPSPVPPAVPTAPAVPASVPVAPPVETSSFAPPRRAVRADEDEDFPLSFGSGGR